MKAKAYRIVNLILAVLVCVFALGYAFAWFAEDIREAEQNFNGSSGSPYFESGTGTVDDPFIISKAYHMYNLAWLQNTGRLTQKYYFKIKDDVTELDLSDFWLPPIGTDANPFMGVFDGNGKIIKGLKVTTDTTRLTNKPSGSDAFSNAVGMFGMTAEGAEITNFNLINPVVEVDKDNATYASGTSSATVGIAIGYANCGASKIGVYNGKLSVEKSDYTTINSIVGGYDPSKVDGDAISGGGANFGSSLDVDKLYQRLGLIYANNTSDNPSSSLPAVELENSKYILSASQCMPLTVANELTSSVYTGSEAKEIPSNQNIGYFCGNQNKIDSKTINFTSYTATETTKTVTVTNEDGSESETTVPITNYSWADGKTAKWFFKRVGSGNTYTSDDIQPLTEDEMAALPKAMRDFLPSSSDSITKSRIRLQQKFSYSGTNKADNDGYWNHGTISYYGEEYADAIIPNTGIWLRTKNAGKMQFLVWSADNGEAFTLYKLARNGEDSNSPLANYFKADIIKPEDYIVELYSTNLPQYTLFYFEYEVQAGEEYLLGKNSGNGAYFLYLDIGTSGEEGGSSGTSLPTLEKIDFIYDDGTNVILIDDASYIVTNVVVKFTTSEIILLYFFRPTSGRDSNDYTLEVQYSGTVPTATISSDGKVYIHEVTTLTFP